MAHDETNARELKAAGTETMPAPALPYRPPVPRDYRPLIGLVGCGGIAASHLEAYRDQGYPVAILCDQHVDAARALRDTYFPGADVSEDPRDVFSRKDVDVVDLATHPRERRALIRAALEADKHVLSQKPFVTDLHEGRALVELAEKRNRKLAVNQNGRWAPYFSYLRQVLEKGLLGEIASCDIHVAWDHTWIKGTAFEKIHHIILYDFGIHWFDIVSRVFGERPAVTVFAQVARAPGQDLAPPLGAHAMVQFEGGLASLSFHGGTRFDPAESTVVTGSRGTYRSAGPVCANDHVTLATEAGKATLQLEGKWFNDGFAGTMGELLCAIEEDREPDHSARANLRSLQLCFAAVASADAGRPVSPDSVQALA